MIELQGGKKFSDVPLPMQPVVSDILTTAGKQPLSYALEAYFTNRLTGISWKIPVIRNVDIQENFESSIGDWIEMDVQLPVSSYSSIMNSYKDLYCTLIGFVYDPHANRKSEFASFIISWCVILPKRADTDKFISPKNIGDGMQIEQKTLMDLNFQMYHPGTTDMRTKKTAGIYRNTTVANMINHLAYIFGAKTVELTPPHNTNPIENLILEPMHNINDIFDYIQARYGIYRTGVSIYYFGTSIDNSRLVVYPKYDYSPMNRVDDALEIYFAGQDNLLNGWMSYRDYPSAGYTVSYNGQNAIVSGTKLICSRIDHSFSKADISADTVGTMSIMYNANRSLDRWRMIQADAKNRAVPVIKTDIVDCMKATKDFLGFSSVQYNPRYDVSYNNPYTISTKLAENNCDVIVGEWLGARPWTFKPGQLVYFTYGKIAANNVTKVPCICTYVTYKFVKFKAQSSDINAFECDASFVLSLTRNN